MKKPQARRLVGIFGTPSHGLKLAGVSLDSLASLNRDVPNTTRINIRFFFIGEGVKFTKVGFNNTRNAQRGCTAGRLEWLWWDNPSLERL